MRRPARSLLAVPASFATLAALVPGGDVALPDPAPALWVDATSPACSDTQARVLDPVHPATGEARRAVDPRLRGLVHCPSHAHTAVFCVR